MEDDKLEFGIGLDVDIPYFKKAWDNKQDEIQKIIDGTKFKIKIDGFKQARKELEALTRTMQNPAKTALVNTDSITGLKNELRGLEMQWASLSEAQKYANKETGQLTEFASNLASRYDALSTSLRNYGQTLKSIEKDQERVFSDLRREAYQSLGQQDFSSAVSSEYFRMLEEESRLLKEKSDAEAQRGAARFRESQRIQQEKQRELQLQREEYTQLVKQYQLEADLANKELQKRNNEKNTSRQRQISEGLRIQHILATQAKTIDQINERLAIQKQRLGQATIGSEKYKKIALDIALLEQRLKSLNASQQRNIETVNLQTDAYKHQAGILNGMKQFINSYISILGAARLGKNIKDITAEFELQRVSLRAITQDVAFADQLFAKLKTTAQQSPFSTKDLVTYTKQLAAYRVENEDLYDTMQMLADISAGLGVGMDRLILAFGQVRAASVLRGTELRQFTEAGIPLVDELADRFSRLRGEIVSTGEVFDLISQREVPFAMVSEIFRDMTEEGGRFYDMQKKQSESLYGVWENLKDALQNAYDEIGRSNSGLLMGVGKTLTSLANNLNNIGAILTPVIAAFGAYRLGIMLSSSSQRGLTRSTKLLQKAEKSLNRDLSKRTKLQGTIYKLTMQARVANNKYALSLIKASTASNVLTASFYRLKAALLANPITAIITAVVAVLTAAITWWKRYNDRLYSSEAAQEKVEQATNSATAAMKQQQAEYDKLIKKVGQYDTLIKNQGKSLEDLKKIYPELYSSYKDEEEANKAATDAIAERKKLIEEIKALSPKYLSDIDTETASVNELASAWRKAQRDMRNSAIQELSKELSKLETQLGELESAPEKYLGLKKVQMAIKHTKEQIEGLTSAINSLKKANQDDDEYLLLWRQRYNELLGGGTMSVDALNEMSFVESIDKTKQAWKKAKEDVVLYRNAINALAKDESINAEDREKQIKRYQAEMAKAASTVRGAESYAKFAGFELEDGSADATKEAIDSLKTELSLVDAVRQRYESLLKYMSSEDAKRKVSDIYGDLYSEDILNDQVYKQKLKEMANEAESLGDKELAQKIKIKIQDIELEDVKEKLESELNKISNQISRQKEASEFFGKMIGLTGNTELATNLTLAITGVDVAQQQDIKGLLTQQISEILSLDVVAPHVDFDINNGIDVSAIQGLIDKIDDKAIKSKLQSALDGYIDYQKDAAIKIQETIAEFADADTRIKSLEAQMNIELSKEPDNTTYQDAVRRKYGQEIGAVRFDAFQEQYAKELDNIDALTVTAIDKIYSELNTLLSSGIFEASDLKSILDLLERLSNVRVEKTSWESFRKAWKAYKDATSDKDKSRAWSDMSSAAKVLESDLKEAEGAINDILDSISDVADAMGLSFGDETENVINAFKDGMGSVTSTMVGFNAVLKICDVTGKSLMSTLWPLLVIGAALGAINYFSNMDVNKANKEIEKQQKAIEDLQRSYENLQQAQEDLFADDWWRNQNYQISNLRRQADAIQKQLRAERSKGKDADEDAIQEYKDSYEEALDDIAEKQKEVFEHFSGTTKYSVIQDFANSAMDAYWTFSNAADGMRDKFRDMLQSMVAESVLAKVISRRLEPVFKAIDDAFGDGHLSNSELANISDKMQMIITTLPDELNAILDSLGLDAWRDASESGLTGIAKGASQASEESILTLAGVGNSLLYNQIVIRDDVSAIRALLEGKVAAVAPSATTDGGMNVGQMVALQQQSVAHLQAIQNNTAQTVSEVRSLNEKIDSVISPIGTRSRKTINTSLR